MISLIVPQDFFFIIQAVYIVLIKFSSKSAKNCSCVRNVASFNKFIQIELINSGINEEFSEILRQQISHAFEDYYFTRNSVQNDQLSYREIKRKFVLRDTC